MAGWIDDEGLKETGRREKSRLTAHRILNTSGSVSRTGVDHHIAVKHQYTTETDIFLRFVASDGWFALAAQASCDARFEAAPPKRPLGTVSVVKVEYPFLNVAA